MFGEEGAAVNALKNTKVKQNITTSINIVTFQAVFAYLNTSKVADD